MVALLDDGFAVEGEDGSDVVGDLGYEVGGFFVEDVCFLAEAVGHHHSD